MTRQDGCSSDPSSHVSFHVRLKPSELSKSWLLSSRSVDARQAPTMLESEGNSAQRLRARDADLRRIRVAPKDVLVFDRGRQHGVRETEKLGVVAGPARDMSGLRGGWKRSRKRQHVAHQPMSAWILSSHMLRRDHLCSKAG
jgi:hypothetical protein